MTLTEFLLACIAEDEATARVAGGDAWEQGERHHETNVVRPAGGFDWVGIAGDRLFTGQISNTPRALWEARAAHIARHDPARVLAECVAKRRIVELYRVRVAQDADEDDRESRLVTTTRCEELEAVLALLALAFADHPDYRQDWAPTG